MSHQVFIDVDNIPAGADFFVRAVREKVAASNVILVVIGPGWLNARDSSGARGTTD